VRFRSPKSDEWLAGERWFRRAADFGRPEPPVTATYRIATISGDGVGPDVVAAARRVVDAAGRALGFDVEWTEHLVGGIAIDTYGVAIRPEDVEACGTADAILLGAVGGPKWSDPSAPVRPEQALFALRGGLGLYANLRPVSVHPALIPSSPLRPELLAGVDLVIVRELTGGVYFGERVEAGPAAGATERRAVDSGPYTETEVRRVVELAFELAADRRGHVTSVDKANVLATSRLWRTVANEVGARHPDVTLAHQLVDSCAMLLVKQPAAFDVIVTENLFGDILSDEAAVLAGSLGMLPSASLGARRTAHGTFGLYEPIHGSAPDIAGRDIANPIGTILSAAMLLRLSLGREDAASAVESAVSAALADGFRTADLVPVGSADGTIRRVGTVGMTEAIVARLLGPDGPADATVDDDTAALIAADTLIGLP
jgi:3-isopropylmalate dehydrogenase